VVVAVIDDDDDDDVMLMMMQSSHVSVKSAASTTPTTFFSSTQRQLTLMLVTICCAAVCLQLPYTVLYLLNDEKTSLWPDREILHARIYFWRKVAEVIETSNCAVNFVLYCLSGSAFRRGVQAMCQRRRKIQRQGGRYEAAMTRTLTVNSDTHRPNKSARLSQRR